MARPSCNSSRIKEQTHTEPQYANKKSHKFKNTKLYQQIIYTSDGVNSFRFYRLETQIAHDILQFSSSKNESEILVWVRSYFVNAKGWLIQLSLYFYRKVNAKRDDFGGCKNDIICSWAKLSRDPENRAGLKFQIFNFKENKYNCSGLFPLCHFEKELNCVTSCFLISPHTEQIFIWELSHFFAGGAGLFWVFN